MTVLFGHISSMEGEIKLQLEKEKPELAGAAGLESETQIPQVNAF